MLLPGLTDFEEVPVLRSHQNVYRSTSRVKELFREVGKLKDKPPHEARSLTEPRQWFQTRGTDLLGPSVGWKE